MSGFETLDVDAFLTTMRNDTALKALFPGGNVIVNADFGLKEPPSFYLVFSMSSAEDTNSIGGHRVFTTPKYTVEAVGREVGFNVLRPIMNRVDVFLTAEAPGRTQGGTFIGRFIRQAVRKRASALDNVRWNYLAGDYELVIFTVAP